MKFLVQILFFSLFIFVPFNFSFALLQKIEPEEILEWKKSNRNTGLVLVYFSIDPSFYKIENAQISFLNQNRERLVLSVKIKHLNTFILESTSGELTIDKFYAESDSARLVKESGISLKENYSFLARKLVKIKVVAGKVNYFQGIRFSDFSPEWNERNTVFDSTMGKSFSGEKVLTSSKLVIKSFLSKYGELKKIDTGDSSLFIESNLINQTMDSLEKNKMKESEIWHTGYKNFRWDIDFKNLQLVLKKNYPISVTLNSFEIVAKKDNLIEKFFFIETKEGIKKLVKIEITLPEEKKSKVISFFEGKKMKKEKDKITFFTIASKIVLEKQEDNNYLLTIFRAIE